MLTLTSSAITIADLETQFNLRYTQDINFFFEWNNTLPALTDIEKERCDRLKTSYLYLLRYPPLLEDTVKMVVLSPLLDLAGFYLPPFHIQSEASIEIIDQEKNVTVKGNLDSLILCESLWVLVIESQKALFSLEAGKAQLLSYLLASPQLPNQPIYGLLTNGSNFAFLKLAYDNDVPIYSLSDEFILHNRENGLYKVLQILKYFAQAFSKNNELTPNS
ncbi:MAG: restriction endonuclease subunit R [Cyanobacteriota bacterium]|nr:restriction endonuclease subunit R [Cyanobacteriota bacterium]